MSQIVRTISGEEGINADAFSHGNIPTWVERVPEGIPDELPKNRVNQLAGVAGPGRILGYLDIAAPDGAGLQIVDHVHDLIVASVNSGGQFPLVICSGPIWARFELERALSHAWHQHLHALMDSLRLIY